jgi:hypothetical protein
MDWLNLLNDIFQVCIIPLLGVLTTYLVKYIQIKMEEIQVKTENELVDKYLSMLASTVTECVIATNQTYVEALKKEGKFDLEAQKKAFEMTRDAVMMILTEEAQDYLSAAVGDLNIFIAQQIEAAVNVEKN